MRYGFGKYKKYSEDCDYDYCLEIPPFTYNFVSTDIDYKKYMLYEKRFDSIIGDYVLTDVFSCNSYHKLRIQLNLMGINYIAYIKRITTTNNKSSSFFHIFLRKMINYER